MAPSVFVMLPPGPWAGLADSATTMRSPGLALLRLCGDVVGRPGHSQAAPASVTW
jgi:hypothetical protein